MDGYSWWKKSGQPVEVGSLSHYLQGSMSDVYSENYCMIYLYIYTVPWVTESYGKTNGK